jgi:hypothetical protein
MVMGVGVRTLCSSVLNREYCNEGVGVEVEGVVDEEEDCLSVEVEEEKQ